MNPLKDPFPLFFYHDVMVPNTKTYRTRKKRFQLYVELEALPRDEIERQHQQTLERLRERGGLDPHELLCSVLKKKWFDYVKLGYSMNDCLMMLQRHGFDIRTPMNVQGIQKTNPDDLHKLMMFPLEKL